MAWPPKAKDIIGMEPEELKTKLESSASKDDLKAITDAQEKNQGTLAEIQATLAKLTTPKTPDPKVEPGDETDPTVQVLTDPKKLIRDETNDIRNSSLRTQAQVQEMRARQDPQFSAIFAKYGKELTETAAKGFPLSSQAQDNFWAYHIRAFLGNKMVTGEIRGDSFPSLLGTSSVGVRADGTTEDKDFGFNGDMADFLKDRGVPLDKAARIRDLMHRDGEPISHKNYFASKGKAA